MDYDCKLVESLVSQSHCSVEQNDVEEPFDKTEWEKACWLVIDTYFAEKGLVRQQLESFNEFIDMTIQHVVKRAGRVELEPSAQFRSAQERLEKVAVPIVCRRWAHPCRPSTTSASIKFMLQSPCTSRRSVGSWIPCHV
jgi:DNA-directed RNA polymerase beta subunit